MKARAAWAAIALTFATGCQFGPHRSDLLHQQILGLGHWSNHDTRGWLSGFGHVTRVSRSPLPGIPNTLGNFTTNQVPVFGATQVDLVLATNVATQVTILITTGPVVVPAP